MWTCCVSRKSIIYYHVNLYGFVLQLYRTNKWLSHFDCLSKPAIQTTIQFKSKLPFDGYPSWHFVNFLYMEMYILYKSYFPSGGFHDSCSTVTMEDSKHKYEIQLPIKLVFVILFLLSISRQHGILTCIVFMLKKVLSMSMSNLPIAQMNTVLLVHYHFRVVQKVYGFKHTSIVSNL